MTELPNRLAVTLLVVVLITTVITTVAFFQLEQSMPVYKTSVKSESVSQVKVRIADDTHIYAEPQKAQVAIKINEVE